MKRILFIAVCLAIGAATAQAQTDYYAEEYFESNGRLSSKIWVSNSNGVYKSRGETYYRGDIPMSADEIPAVTISRMERDTVKIYTLDRKTKTYSVMVTARPLAGNLAGGSVDGNSTTEIAARLGVDEPTRKEEFLGMETINGYECKHYRSTWSNGGYRERWIYEPFKVAMQRKEGNVVYTKRVFRQGAQPESLFELPADYKPQSNDIGNEIGNTMNILDALKQSQPVQQQQQQQSSEGQSEQERLMEALKMLGGGK